MKVLVTGAVGFLGSHISLMGKQLGWDVVGIDNFTDYELKASGYATVKSKDYNAKLLNQSGISIIRGDLRDTALISSLKDIDYIVHTAAQPCVTLAIEDPRYDMENDVIATFNMLELARKLDIPIGICSSAHVFGNNINKNLEETEEMFQSFPQAFDEEYSFLDGRVTPLHASKAINEIHGRAYIDTYGLEVGIMRLTGMYGPRQFAGMNHGWVSNFIFRMLKGLPLYIFGTDKQVRDILYAEDASRLFFNYYKHSYNSGLYSIGGGISNAVSLIQVINKVSNLTGIKSNIVMQDAREYDLNYFVADISKAWRNLDWEPQITVDEGLQITINWAKENLEYFEVSK